MICGGAKQRCAGPPAESCATGIWRSQGRQAPGRVRGRTECGFERPVAVNSARATAGIRGSAAKSGVHRQDGARVNAARRGPRSPLLAPSGDRRWPVLCRQSGYGLCQHRGGHAARSRIRTMRRATTSTSARLIVSGPQPRRLKGCSYLFSLGSLKYLVPLIVSSAASPLEVNWYTLTPGETDCASVIAAP